MQEMTTSYALSDGFYEFRTGLKITPETPPADGLGLADLGTSPLGE